MRRGSCGRLMCQSCLRPTALHLHGPCSGGSLFRQVPERFGSDILTSPRVFRILQRPLTPWSWEPLSPIITDPNVSSPSSDARLDPGHWREERKGDTLGPFSIPEVLGAKEVGVGRCPHSPRLDRTPRRGRSQAAGPLALPWGTPSCPSPALPLTRLCDFR